MTSKERVLRAFAREKSDRMPIDYLGNIGINKKLCGHFGTDYFGMLDALDIDFRPICPSYVGKLLFPAKEGMAVDPVYGFYGKWVEHSSGGYWDFCYFPLKGAPDEVIASYPVASPDDFDYDSCLEQIKAFKGRALYVGNAGFADVINSTGRLMGMEQTLVNLMLGDEATMAYINRKVEMELAQLERTIEKAKGEIDFLLIGEDLGTQIAPMISLDLYRRALKPIHKKYVDLAKAYGLYVMMHSCGSSSWAYEEFIEMGVDAVDTLQPEAANMSPEYLVERFGGRLSFHGSVSTAGPLAYGTPEEVEEDVKAKCDIYRHTYSYMISPTHSIQDNSPLENVLKLYEAAKKYGRY